ncbi:hypothetical protein HMI55_000271 [Coelomomyces lativittatus]|nr:hypothetical protein HMI55_000271 [Coelomomyces lativittatus]
MIGSLKRWGPTYVKLLIRLWGGTWKSKLNTLSSTHASSRPAYVEEEGPSSWGQAWEEEEVFIHLKQFCERFPTSHYPSAILKGMYFTLLQRGEERRTPPKERPTLRWDRKFAQTLAMYGRNDLTYHMGFLYLQQMALHVRHVLSPSVSSSSSSSKKKPSSGSLAQNKKGGPRLSSSYYHSLIFWSQVLLNYTHPHELFQTTTTPTTTTLASSSSSSSSSKKHVLTSLIFPVLQLLCGTLRGLFTSSSSPAWFPVTLRLLDLGSQLMHHTGVYVPLASMYLHVLHGCVRLASSGFHTVPTVPLKLLPPLDFQKGLTCPPRYVHTPMYFQQITQLTLEGFLNHCVHVAGGGEEEGEGGGGGWIGFPEWCTPVCLGLSHVIQALPPGWLRRPSPLSKKKKPSTTLPTLPAHSSSTPDPDPDPWGLSFVQSLTTLHTTLQQHQTWILLRRQASELCPQDLDACHAFVRSLASSSSSSSEKARSPLLKLWEKEKKKRPWGRGGGGGLRL